MFSVPLIFNFQGCSRIGTAVGPGRCNIGSPLIYTVTFTSISYIIASSWHSYVSRFLARASCWRPTFNNELGGFRILDGMDGYKYIGRIAGRGVDEEFGGVGS